MKDLIGLDVDAGEFSYSVLKALIEDLGGVISLTSEQILNAARSTSSLKVYFDTPEKPKQMVFFEIEEKDENKIQENK